MKAENESPLSQLVGRVFAEAEAIVSEHTERHGDLYVEEGFDGLFYNVRRKYLRVKRAIAAHRLPQIDDAYDLINYTAMIIVLMKTHPELIEQSTDDPLGLKEEPD